MKYPLPRYQDRYAGTYQQTRPVLALLPHHTVGSTRVLDRNSRPSALRLANQVYHRIQERLVVEAALGQVEVGAHVEAADPVFLTVLVRHDDHGNGLQPGVLLDVGNELDAVHTGHVDVADHQVVTPGTDRVPAVHAIDGDVHRVAAVLEQLPLELTDSDRIVHHQDSLGTPRFFRHGRLGAQLLDLAAAEQVVDRADQVLDIDDQNRPAVLEHRRAIEVGNLT